MEERRQSMPTHTRLSNDDHNNNDNSFLHDYVILFE